MFTFCLFVCYLCNEGVERECDVAAHDLHSNPETKILSFVYEKFVQDCFVCSRMKSLGLPYTNSDNCKEEVFMET